MILLKNGKNSRNESMSILIKENKIHKIFNGNEKIDVESNDLQIIELQDKLILPGIIDPHTHMRDPGFTAKEDFTTGSKACAKGGITTFMDMPNTNPATITYESLLSKKKIAKQKSIVNYGFHFGGSRSNNIEEIKKVIEKNAACAVKLFLNVSTGEMLVEDDEILNGIFENSELIMVHAENEMIDKAAELAKKHKKRLYVCHISSKSEMEKVIKYKNDAVDNDYEVYAEVTPHHLFINEATRESNETNKKLLRMKPELKTKEDNEYLWNALLDGQIDTIGTDHAPHLLSEKEKSVVFGVPGIETSLALMIDAYNKNEISLELIENVMSNNAAKIFSLDKKGKLEEGYDADIIVVDTNRQWTVKKEEIESKCGWSPFEGYELLGKNYITVVNGNIVYIDGEFDLTVRGDDVSE
jgi:dihydroorotase